MMWHDKYANIANVPETMEPVVLKQATGKSLGKRKRIIAPRIDQTKRLKKT